MYGGISGVPRGIHDIQTCYTPNLHASIITATRHPRTTSCLCIILILHIWTKVSILALPSALFVCRYAGLGQPVVYGRWRWGSIVYCRSARQICHSSPVTQIRHSRCSRAPQCNSHKAPTWPMVIFFTKTAHILLILGSWCITHARLLPLYKEEGSFDSMSDRNDQHIIDYQVLKVLKI